MASPSPSPSPSASASPEAPLDELVDASFTRVYVKAWGSLPISMRVERGQVASWEWRTEAHDMQFSASFQPDAPEEADTNVAAAASAKKGKKSKPPPAVIVHALTRVSTADQMLQHGSYKAGDIGGTLTLLWDNSYSKLRGKNLAYKTSVVDASRDSSRSGLPFGEVRLTPFGAGTIEGVRESDDIYVVGLAWGASAYLNAETLLDSPVAQPPRNVNQRVNVGVDLFFNNRVWEAEAFFKREVDRYPHFSLGYGSLGFLRALMSWSKADIASANARLKHTRTFVQALLPAESTLASVGRFLTRSSDSGNNGMTPQHLEYTLLQAEAYLLQAMLLFTEESYMSYVKAGLRIRSAWKLYQKCQEQLASWDAATRAQLDPSVLGGVQFGIGTFNVVISTLPPVLLRVVSALGFPSDRKKGLELLSSCAATPGIRQSLSSLMLLFVHVLMPSFFTVRPSYHAQVAEGILADAFKRYPRGALFLWMRGRLRRSQRDLPGAVAAFQSAARGQPSWTQLQHLCAYELGFCHFFALDFMQAAACWDMLVKENSWSKAFFVYMHAVCLLSAEQQDKRKAVQAGAAASSSAAAASSAAAVGGRSSSPANSSSRSEEALRLLSSVESSITRKFGGRVIGIEQFVSRRAAQFLSVSDGGHAPVLADVELIYLFYGLIQTSDECLLECLRACDAVLSLAAAAVGDLSAEERALALLLKASILKGLRRWNFAKLLLQQLEVELHGSSAPSLDALAYVAPFARFELASLIMEQVHEKDEAIAAAASAASAGGPKQPASSCSLDEPMPLDAGPGTAPAGSPVRAAVAAAIAASASFTTGASTPAAWEAQRAVLLDSAWSWLKKAEGAKATYLFANRLHLRIHLACVEVKMMRRHWDDRGGNVQDEAAVAAAFGADDAASAAAAGEKLDDSEGEAED